jgi:hypothetical protein
MVWCQIRQNYILEDERGLTDVAYLPLYPEEADFLIPIRKDPICIDGPCVRLEQTVLAAEADQGQWHSE